MAKLSTEKSSNLKFHACFYTESDIIWLSYFIFKSPAGPGTFEASANLVIFCAVFLDTSISFATFNSNLFGKLWSFHTFKFWFLTELACLNCNLKKMKVCLDSIDKETLTFYFNLFYIDRKIWRKIYASTITYYVKAQNSNGVILSFFLFKKSKLWLLSLKEWFMIIREQKCTVGNL